MACRRPCPPRCAATASPAAPVASPAQTVAFAKYQGLGNDFVLVRPAGAAQAGLHAGEPQSVCVPTPRAGEPQSV